MLNDYRQIISAMKNSPWVITQEGLEMILEIVNMRLSGKAFSDEEIRQRLQEVESDNRESTRVEVGGGVGVISLYGPMFPKANLMTELSGASSLEQFKTDLRGLVDNDSVKQIVLDIDSPGGSAIMVPETGKAIREARDEKPVYALANAMAASGALWLGSQATTFYATESGKVGSLGVYTVHEDYSSEDKAEGRKVTFVSAGEYKTEANEHEPLSEKGRAYLQEGVDEIYEDFVEAVAEGRGLSVEKVRTDFGDAKIHSAKKALSIGMIDGIGTMEELIGELVEENLETRSTVLSSAVAKMHREGESLMAEGGLRRLLPGNSGSSVGKVRVEVAPQEHADPPNPGEGAPTNQTERDRALGDEGGAGGSRRDTPPIAQDEEVKGGNVVNEFMVALCERLGLDPEDATEEDILVAAQTLEAEVTPLREAAREAKVRSTFREQFPEEYEKMKHLEHKDKEAEAKAFASQYERLTKKDGDKEVPTTHGFSARTIESVERIYLGFAENTVNITDFEEFLDSIAATGLVDYSERGSSRTREAVTAETGGKAFSQLVSEVMEQDNLEYSAAVKVAAQKYPEEFAAYRAEARPERR